MNDRYLTVTALTKYIKRKLSGDPHLKEVWLRGEISNFKHHSRGHMYMSLKDSGARIQSVMFAGNNKSLKFRPENGMNVLIRGEINVYEPMGQYQLYIQEMQPDGIGDLHLAFEQLKEKLEKEGLFKLEHKKTIPPYPKHIGVITSPTGAAVRDIITTISRRYPIVPLTILPVLVQGERTAQSVSKAIQYANEQLDCDLLIVGRGGGSIEDLWGFNEERVARSIFQSNIPIISAVGHETDTTISDFVSDVRAATPTGAGELAVPSIVELAEKIQSFNARLQRAMDARKSDAEQHLTRLRKSYAFKYPVQLLQQKEQDLDRTLEQLSKQMKTLYRYKEDQLIQLQKRLMQKHPEAQVKENKTQLQSNTKQLHLNFQHQLERKQERFRFSLDKLTLLNPLDIMKRGYAIPFSENGNVIKDAKKVHKGSPLSLKMHNGRLHCRVEEIEEDEYGGE